MESYAKARVLDQIKILKKFFSGKASFDGNLLMQIDKSEVVLPEGAEEWFAVLQWEKFFSSYSEAVERVLAAISEMREGQFVNYRKKKLGSAYLRQKYLTTMFFHDLSEKQGNNDVFVLPAQFGSLHKGLSVHRALENLKITEVGLGTFAVGCMLLTHPDRLENFGDLWADCAGDEYAEDGNDKFNRTPSFGFEKNGKVRFDAFWSDSGNSNYGSVTGFILEEQGVA